MTNRSAENETDHLQVVYGGVIWVMINPVLSEERYQRDDVDSKSGLQVFACNQSYVSDVTAFLFIHIVALKHRVSASLVVR